MFLFRKQVIHSYYVYEIATIFVVCQTVCCNKRTMNSHLSGNVFEKNVLAMHKFCVITNMLLFFNYYYIK